MRLVFVLLALVLGVAPDSHAQLVTATPGIAVYRYAEPGQPTKDIRVWGAVRAPGIYQVEQDVDLIEVLTMAGGPVRDRELASERREFTVRLSRDTGASRMIVFEADVDALFQRSTGLPAIEDGDVVSVDVEVHQRFQWRDALSIFSALGTVAIVVLNIVRLNN